MNLDITCKTASISTEYGGKEIRVYMDDIDKNMLDTEEVASCVGIETFIAAIGLREILSYIGKEECINHFDIKEKEND